jgi:hypothetical protein
MTVKMCVRMVVGIITRVHIRSTATSRFAVIFPRIAAKRLSGDHGRAAVKAVRGWGRAWRFVVGVGGGGARRVVPTATRSAVLRASGLTPALG